MGNERGGAGGAERDDTRGVEMFDGVVCGDGDGGGVKKKKFYQSQLYLDVRLSSKIIWQKEYLQLE